MANSNKKTIILSIIAVAVFIALVVSTSYAYYSGTISKTGTSTTTVNTTTLKATFTDGATLNFQNMIPGDTFTKTFTLKNTGAETLKYKVVIQNVSNTFSSPSDITLVLKEGSTTVKSTTFPTATGAISGTLTISPNATKTYTITITYKNTNKDQSADMGKTISGKIFIEGA